MTKMTLTDSRDAGVSVPTTNLVRVFFVTSALLLSAAAGSRLAKVGAPARSLGVFFALS